MIKRHYIKVKTTIFHARETTSLFREGDPVEQSTDVIAPDGVEHNITWKFQGVETIPRWYFDGEELEYENFEREETSRDIAILWKD